MIKKTSFLWLLLFAVTAAAPLAAQEKPSNLPDCRKRSVQDSDKRDFINGDVFTLDVDGDGAPDTVTTRVYALKTKRSAARQTEPPPRETHWIAFDLKTAKGRVVKSFFKYQYGTDEADFYVYALIPCRVDGDRYTDFLFYAGDEQSDETVVLVSRGNKFKVFSRKINDG